MQRRRIVLGSLAATAAWSFAVPASAQKFPDKPVTLVVPFAPGGNLDIVARTLAPALGAALGQPVLIDNRAGAGGGIGSGYVAHAKADGHTLLVSTPNALVVLPLMTRTPYQLSDFRPVGLVASTPLVVVVQAQSRFKTIEALLAEARARPGALTVGHSGTGTTSHVAILLFEQTARLSLSAIPYKGSGPALTDLVGGQTDLMVDQLTSSSPFIRAGTLRVLAVMSRERDPTLPAVPTLREAGLAGFDATTLTGLLAPAGTPADAIETLNAALRKALDDPAVKRSLLAAGSPGRPSSAQEWLDVLRQEESNAQALAAAGKLKTE